MSDKPWIIERRDLIAFRDDLGHSVCWGSILDAYSEEAEAHKTTFLSAGYEYVKNGSDDWWHTDGDLYQGSTLMRVIRNKEGQLFGFAYWEGGGKHGETNIEHNGDDHGFPSKYDWQEGVEEEERWYVFRPVEVKPIPAVVFRAAR